LKNQKIKKLRLNDSDQGSTDIEPKNDALQRCICTKVFILSKGGVRERSGKLAAYALHSKRVLLGAHR
jgi:hypothetical protein